MTKHSAAETASVPEQEVPSHESPSRWLRVRQWLGLVSSTSQREANGAVSNGNGVHAAQQSGEGDHDERPKTAGQIFDEAWEHQKRADERAAGGSEGRIVPALVLGDQRYPDPSVWGPPNAQGALTTDDDYGKAIELIYELGLPEELERRGY